MNRVRGRRIEVVSLVVEQEWLVGAVATFCVSASLVLGGHPGPRFGVLLLALFALGVVSHAGEAANQATNEEQDEKNRESN